jgi:NAD(P)-dependent dehydrogenase (short-subunit alcohol dehydrogenase family)
MARSGQSGVILPGKTWSMYTEVCMKKLVSIASLLSILLLSASALAESHDNDHKAVLITGATTGIGRATAEHLAAKGYFVYAGARKDADMEALNKIDNIVAVRLDVTRQDQVDAAVKFIEDQGRGLWGLVNNAGVAVFAPLTEAKQADLEFIFDVNVFGVFRVTQAFAPMIIESKGRIVNVSSISGIYSAPTAGMYSGSKHALEAMTDSFAFELRDLGVHVTAVNPGSVASAGFGKDCGRMLDDAGADWGHLEDIRQWRIDRCKKRQEPGYNSGAADPIVVALTIEQALFEDKPRGRYLVASQGGAGETIAWGIREVLALNIGHDQSYTRDEIVRFIDLIWPYMSGERSWNSQEDEWDTHDSWIERRLPDKD